MQNKSICFIGNFEKTIVFAAISEYLLDNDINIYWIITKPSQYKYLSAKFKKENILLIDSRYITMDKAPIGDFKINELVFGDRVRKYRKKESIRYLTNIQQPVYDFIKGNKITYMFGETTWAHELLMHRICNQFKELECQYYADHTIRIPTERFVFFKDEKQLSIVERKNTENNYLSIHPEKPLYLGLNNKILSDTMTLKGLGNRFRRLITGENIERMDPQVLHCQYRIIIPLKEVVNQILYRFLKKHRFNSIENKKYIFFGFHKQPEASVDVCGRYLEDQFETVVNIWRQLPPEWLLAVKEHPNAIGDRSYFFFKRICQYSNIVIIDENEDSHRLIQSAQLVMTNTGTIALEAALMNIPAITLSAVFFNRLKYCRHCNWQDLEKYNSITDLINEIKGQPNNIEEYTQYIMTNSFEGINTSLMSVNLSYLTDDNIAKFAGAVKEIIN
jgi:hypothetical protein